MKTIETSANLFSVLGVARSWVRASRKTDRSSLARRRLWSSAIGCGARVRADPNILGKQLNLNGTPNTVVGVMPAGFQFPDDIDVWQRLKWDLAQHSRAAHFMEGVARLADGTSFEQARSAADTLAARLGQEFPEARAGHSAWCRCWTISWAITGPRCTSCLAPWACCL